LKSVSFIICVYNGEKYIDRAIRSCLNQVLIDIATEVIVIDDASTDNTGDVCKAFGSSIVYKRMKVNSGVSVCSNVGINLAKSEFYMRVDSDDFINNLTLMNLLPILIHNPHYDFVVNDHVRVDLHGQKNIVVSLDSIHQVFRHGAGVLFRKKSVVDAGMYDESLRNCEDFDLLAKMIFLFKSEYFHYPVPLYRYYIHDSNLTGSESRKSSWAKVAQRYNLHLEEIFDENL